MDISVIIATYNRLHSLSALLRSLSLGTYQSKDTIIVDQSSKKISRQVAGVAHKYHARYYHIARKGLGVSRNFGLHKARHSIVAFVDDDCIVSNTWLKTAYSLLHNAHSIVGVFGKTMPYRPKQNRGKLCPCTFTKRKKSVITKPTLHYKHIGYGNNMAFKKPVLISVGGFKEWLGHGSIGMSAEDAEIALRLLIHRHKLLYEPKLLAYHNKWLNKKEFDLIFLSYTCGELACYGYFFFKGYPFAREVMFRHGRDSFNQIRSLIVSLIKNDFSRHIMRSHVYELKKLFYRFRGLIVGLYYAVKEPTKLYIYKILL